MTKSGSLVTLGLLGVIAGAGVGGMAPVVHPHHSEVPRAAHGAAHAAAPPAAAVLHRIPLYFEANRGQGPAAAAFLARGPGFRLGLTAQGPVLALGRAGGRGGVVRIRPVGGRPGLVPIGRGRQPGEVNYVRGRDAAAWHQGVPVYARVLYRQVYPGVDLIFHGRQDQLEYDFRLAAGVPAGCIRLAFDGAAGATVDPAGRLHVRTAAGEIVQPPPRAFQRIDGREWPVASRYVAAADGTVGFDLGRYDHRRPLVIDPVLSFAAFIGGTGDDRGLAIARQGDSVYITGQTGSSDFITALQAAVPGLPVADADCGGRVGCSPAAASDTFGGTAVDTGVWQTSGTVSEDGQLLLTTGAAAGDQAGVSSKQALLKGDFQAQVSMAQLDQAEKQTGMQIVIGADTYTFMAVSSGGAQDYEVTTPPACTVTPAPVAATSADFQATGQLVVQRTGSTLTFDVYSPKTALLKTFTVVGGCSGVGTGDATVTLFTKTLDAAAKTSAFTDFYVAAATAGPDAFVLRLDNGGTTLGYATYLGGSAQDYGLDIAVDAAGNAYVAGHTFSSDFPATAGAFSTSCMDVDGNGQCDNGGDAFVARLSTTGTLSYATYFGGCFDDAANAVAVDDAGDIYIAGYTESAPDTATSTANGCTSEFPVKNTNSQFTSYHGRKDAFVAKLTPQGAGSADLVYSMFLGGSFADEALGIAVSAAHEAYVTGYTASSDFPLVNPVQSVMGATTSYDAFVARIDAAGDALSFSTFFGGSAYDYGSRIAVDSAGDAYITGWTRSDDLLSGVSGFTPLQGANNGSYDAFVAEMDTGAHTLVYATYLGGAETDTGQDIALDGDGSVVITGYSESADFLVALLKDVRPDLAPTLTTLGNLDNLILNNMSVDDLAQALSDLGDATSLATLKGETRSVLIGAIFARVGTLIDQELHAVQQSLGGSTDAVVVRLNPGGTGIAMATYLGGGDDDAGTGVVLGADGQPYVTGYTVTNTNIAGLSQATNFPSTTASNWKAAQTAGLRDEDVFIAKYAAGESDLAVTITADPSGHVTRGATVTFTITVTNKGSDPAPGVVVTDLLPIDLVMVSASATQGSCTPSQADVTKFTNKITCSFGTLAAGASRQVTVKTTAGAMEAPLDGSEPIQTVSAKALSSGTGNSAAATTLLTTVDASAPLQSERTCNISSTKAYGCSPPKLGGMDGWSLALLAACAVLLPPIRRRN